MTDFDKTIGNLSVLKHHQSDAVTIEVQYNEGSGAEIRLRDIEQVRDLRYAIDRLIEGDEAWRRGTAR